MTGLNKRKQCNAGNAEKKRNSINADDAMKTSNNNNIKKRAKG
jgi:hypothetical protein